MSVSNALFVIVATIFLTRCLLDPILEATRITVGGSEIGFGAVINVLVIGVAFLSILANYKILPLWDLVAWIAFLTLCVVASIETTNPVSVGRTVLGLLSYLCVFIIPLCLVKSIRHVDRLTDVILLSSLLPASVALLQIATNLGNGDFRVQSSFSHPNIFAFYIVVVMATILFKWSSHLFSPSLLRRLVYIAYFAVLGALLVYTKTRSAWFGAALLLTMFALFIDRRAILVLLMVAAIAVLDPGIRDRLLDAGSQTEYIGDGVIMNSYAWRMALWSGAFVWIEERPFLGHGGLGTFFENSIHFFPYGERSVYAHSTYVQLLFEVGLLGLILFVAIFLLILWRLARLAWIDWSASIVGLALCLAYLVFCYADNMLSYLASMWYFFFFLGILVATERIRAVRNTPSTYGEASAHYISSDKPRYGQHVLGARRRSSGGENTFPFCRKKPQIRRAARRKIRLSEDLSARV